VFVAHGFADGEADPEGLEANGVVDVEQAVRISVNEAATSADLRMFPPGAPSIGGA
jgi:hypothetical protein